jgi:hypothetical protein
VIFPDFDGDLSFLEMSWTLPLSQLTENVIYQTHITHFPVVSIAEIHSGNIITLDPRAGSDDITGF